MDSVVGTDYVTLRCPRRLSSAAHCVTCCYDVICCMLRQLFPLRHPLPLSDCVACDRSCAGDGIQCVTSCDTQRSASAPWHSPALPKGEWRCSCLKGLLLTGLVSILGQWDRFNWYCFHAAFYTRKIRNICILHNEFVCIINSFNTELQSYRAVNATVYHSVDRSCFAMYTANCVFCVEPKTS